MIKTAQSQLRASNKYNATIKGKLKRKIWETENRDKINAYQRSYHKARRTLLKKMGICVTCQTRKTETKKQICPFCKHRMNIYNKKRKHT